MEDRLLGENQYLREKKVNGISTQISSTLSVSHHFLPPITAGNEPSGSCEPLRLCNM